MKRVHAVLAAMMLSLALTTDTFGPNPSATLSLQVVPANPQPGAVMRAFDFYNKFGVNANTNTHTVQQLLKDMNYVGIKNLRVQITNYIGNDSADSSAAYMGQFSAAGIRLWIFAEGASGYPFGQISAWISALKNRIVNPYGADMVTGVGGPNEPDLDPIFCFAPGLYGVECNNPAAIQLQHDLYTGMKADPALSGISVDLWPMDYLTYNNPSSLGDQSAYCQRPNLHDYYANDPSGPVEGIPEKLQNYYLPIHRTVCNHQNFITTESGFKSTCSFGPTYGEYVQARYTLRNMFEHAMRPDLDLFYIFALEWSDGDCSNNSGWGLLNDDGSPKLSGTAVHNLMLLLSDTGFKAKAFSTIPLNYSLSGMPAAGRQFLIQKSNGHYQILLWNNAQIWATQGPPWNCCFVPVTSVSLTVTLPSSMSGNVYDPINNGQTSIQTITNQTTVTVSLGDAPLIIEVF